LAAPQIILFPHRQNRDGSLDSICITCFATVGSASTDAELSDFDKKHVCDPGQLSDQASFHRRAEMREKFAER
jgi:hypothetical protein